MAYYLIALREEIMNNCRNRIVQLAAVISLLDESRRALLLMLLAQYVTVKYDRLGCINKSDGTKWIVTDINVVADSPSIMKKHISLVLTARNDMNHCYGTSVQLKSWDAAWSDGHVEAVLKYEGFI